MAPAGKSQMDGGPEWECILAITHDMLIGARQREWERVSEMQQKRFELIQRYFESTPTIRDIEFIRPAVEKMLDIDKGVTELSCQAREELAKGLKSLRDGKSARRAYGRHSK